MQEGTRGGARQWWLLLSVSTFLDAPLAFTMLMIETADIYSWLTTCLELGLLSAASDCQKPSEDKGPWTQPGSARDEIQKQGPSSPLFCASRWWQSDPGVKS